MGTESGVPQGTDLVIGGSSDQTGESTQRMLFLMRDLWEVEGLS